jgi:hypothetical protein
MPEDSSIRLRWPGLYGPEYFGDTKTDGHIFWHEEPQRDGSIKRIALIPINPQVHDASRLVS